MSIGFHWIPFESIGVGDLIKVDLTRSEVLPIGAHWSPLELKNRNEGFLESNGVGGVDGVGGVRTKIFIH